MDAIERCKRVYHDAMASQFNLLGDFFQVHHVALAVWRRSNKDLSCLSGTAGTYQQGYCYQALEQRCMTGHHPDKDLRDADGRTDLLCFERSRTVSGSHRDMQIDRDILVNIKCELSLSWDAFSCPASSHYVNRYGRAAPAAAEEEANVICRSSQCSTSLTYCRQQIAQF